MHLFKFFLSSLFTLVLIACSSSVPNTTTLNKEISGIWKISSGTDFSGLNMTTFQYFQFNENGTASEIHQDADTNILASIDFIYSVVNDTTVSMALSSSGGGHKISNGISVISNKLTGLYQAFGGGNLYFYEQTDSTTLTLTDNSENTITLTKQEELPAEFTCMEFSEPTTYANLPPEPYDRSNLVWDGTLLWYSEDETNKIYSFNPETGETGSGYDVSAAGQYVYIQAAQGSEFWTHCNCGWTNDAKSIDSSGTVSSTINTDTDLSHEISIDSMAFDGTHLWFFGDDTTTNDYKFLKVDTSGPTLSGVFDFDFGLNAITWDGTHFWAITSFYSNQFIIKINPDASGFTSVASYKSPDAGIEFVGIAAVGSDLYLLGVDDSAENKGVITKVTP